MSVHVFHGDRLQSAEVPRCRDTAVKAHADKPRVRGRHPLTDFARHMLLSEGEREVETISKGDRSGSRSDVMTAR